MGIMAREVLRNESSYIFIDYQVHAKTRMIVFPVLLTPVLSI